MRERITTLVLAALLVMAASSFGVGIGVGTPAAGQETTTTDTPDLDLREANVVGVEFEAEAREEAGEDDPRSYDFSVTLSHDDEGEPGYANWWQVETLDGTELGRRDLLHAHGTRPFTRSEHIEVPANVSLVVVRGHDETHGYGGQATVVDLRTGATETLRQGPEPRNVTECEVLADEGLTANETTTGTANEPTTGTAVDEADLVRCPWEKSGNATTTG